MAGLRGCILDGCDATLIPFYCGVEVVVDVLEVAVVQI
jgi:hypothetical protein